jgi:hypothetical protein
MLKKLFRKFFPWKKEVGTIVGFKVAVKRYFGSSKPKIEDPTFKVKAENPEELNKVLAGLPDPEGVYREESSAEDNIFGWAWIYGWNS